MFPTIGPFPWLSTTVMPSFTRRAMGSIVARVIESCSSNVPVPPAGRIAFPPRVITADWGSVRARGPASREVIRQRARSSSARSPDLVRDVRANAAQRLADVFDRVGVGKPDVTFAAGPERCARERRHARFLEKRPLHLLALHVERLDIREHVEGPGRLEAPESGNPVQPLHDLVAPTVELRDHGPDRLLRAAERRDARALNE